MRLGPALSWTVLHAAAVLSASAVSYHGFSLFRLMPTEQEHLLEIEHFISQTRTRYPDSKQIDVWKGPIKVNRSVDLLLSPTVQKDFVQFFDHINYTRPIPDIQKKIDEEAKDKADSEEEQRLWQKMFGWSKVLRDSSPTSRTFFNKYQSLEKMHEYMRDLARRNPHIVQLTTIGQGHEGNDLLVMQVASSVGKIEKKPSVWVDGGIHAREWISPMTVLYFIKELVEGYDKGDREIRFLVDNIAWYFLPVLNPDGYKHSYGQDRLWRKNKRPNNIRSNWCDDGVDLNRNFDWHHCGLGASRDPCSEIYCGRAAFSEPESRALSNYIKRLKRSRNLMVYITLHSYSQIWTYPYAQPGRQGDGSTATQVRDALRDRHGRRQTLDDWAKGKAGVRFVYLVELRPCDLCDEGFILPASKIRPTGEETWAALKIVAKQALSDYELEQRLKQRTRRPSSRKSRSRRRNRNRSSKRRRG